VFVTSAPDVVYFKDTNGDGTADERRVVLTGFDIRRTPQIRFSHPTLGLDNWVYLTSGLNGGNVTAPEHPERPPVKFTTSDSRFDPFTMAFELTGGQSQYGLTFDDYGRRFTCSNRHPIWHVVLEPRHLKRNPHLAFSATVQEVSTVGAQAVVWPISADMTTASFHPSLMSTPHAGTFTAASGVHIHRGDALPDGDRESIFICESAQNIVQRQIRSAKGVTFASRPARSGREFLASRDNWFRPVFAANGPDGALYIVDMYRKTIDHPQYVPEASRPELDFEAGKGRGRIYRIVAQNWKRENKTVHLHRMDARELSRQLEHPNAWWRETAQRLLVGRRDRAAVPFLRATVREGRREVARIHALWTLAGLAALEAGEIVEGLRDRHAAVRENAVRLAEARLGTSSDLLGHVLRLANDPDDRVRFHVALALGESSDPRAIDALAAIARRDGADRWVRAAVLSSVRERSHEFMRTFVASPSSDAVRAAVMQDLGQIFGASQTADRCLDLILEIAQSGGNLSWEPAALSGIAQGLHARKLAFTTLLSSESPKAAAARQVMAAVFRRAAVLALDEKSRAESRVAAIALLGHTDYATAGTTLERLLAPSQASELQVAAVRALSQLRDDAAAASLVERGRWLAFTPELREAVLSSLIADERQIPLLLDALETGSISPTALSPSRRNRLANHQNAAIQTRARRLFAVIDSGDRMQVYERLRGAIRTRPGSADSGSRIFATHCATCHTFGDVGGRLGPDLSGIRNQPADAILLHILMPDYEITPGYQSYIVETREGRTLVGRLESEAPNSLTLRDASSESHVILRSQVVSIAASGSSLMPNELERVMSDQDLADLLAYLKSARTRR
jgi:putative membrane-bound dehydrogenase-like protein